MTRRIFDTFMFNNEFEVLEARLLELESVPNLTHVAVEADVDHQDHPKPFLLSEQSERFAEWAERLIVVRASGLPTAADAPDPWARERAQREHAGRGLMLLAAEDNDVVLHGDVDEIPTALVARNVFPRGMVAFEQRGHFWAIDWTYPIPWRGTVAATAGGMSTFNAMRDARNVAPPLHDAGWHLSWLPSAGETSAESAARKVRSFCHPEVLDRIERGVESDQFVRDGVHVDGVKMIASDVDGSWPRYVTEGRCPESWFRPR